LRIIISVCSCILPENVVYFIYMKPKPKKFKHQRRSCVYLLSVHRGRGKRIKRYVGQTVNFKTRWNRHCLPSKKIPISSAIQKYGKDNVDTKILHSGLTQKEADKLEYTEIKKYKTFIGNGLGLGYNRNTGGGGNSGVTRSAKTKARHRKTISNWSDEKKASHTAYLRLCAAKYDAKYRTTIIDKMLCKRFGRLLVTEYNAIRSNQSRDYYICICDCGTTKTIMGDLLRNRSTRSCGCLVVSIAIARNKEPRNRTIAKMVGKTFKYITVLEYLPGLSNNEHGHDWYCCRCVCGTKKNIRGTVLRLGLTISCGCVGKTVRAATMIGQKFNQLIVKEYLADKSKTSGLEYYRCLCDCGEHSIVNGVKLRSGHTKSCGCLRLNRLGDVDVLLKRSETCLIKAKLRVKKYIADGAHKYEITRVKKLVTKLEARIKRLKTKLK